jgi:cell wall-active antibiotic response 4TMS protein YvqF
MKCAVHTEVDAAGYCRNCGKALCAECARDVRGILYCENCLAETLTKPQSPAAPEGSGSVGLATFLGFIPGLGAVYNGQYMKALVHVILFAALIGFVNTEAGDRTEPAGGLAIAAFVVYMAIEANRTARAKLKGEPCPDVFGNVNTRVPVGPLILIGLGILFLLDKLRMFNLEKIFEYWPVWLIALGVFLLWRRVAGSSSSS